MNIDDNSLIMTVYFLIKKIEFIISNKEHKETTKWKQSKNKLPNLTKHLLN